MTSTEPKIGQKLTQAIPIVNRRNLASQCTLQDEDMTIDLACLLGLALWTLVLNHTPSIGRIRTAGVAWGLSNREETPTVAPWIGRADRAQRNHHENLPMLAIVMLIAHVTGRHDGVTAVASAVILVARMAHGVVYIWGIQPLRPLFYALSIVGMLTIVSRIVF